MRIRHGSLVVDVPDDWRDESTLVFVAPAVPQTIPAQNPVSSSGESVVIRCALAGGASAEEIIDAQAKALTSMDPDFQILKREPFSFPVGKGLLVEQLTHIGGLGIMQLVGCVIVGPVVINATASAPEDEFETARPRLMRIVGSLSAEP